MSASIHEKLNRVRKPRVHITYDVETEGAQVQRELPFVMGVLGDFSGDPTMPLRPLSDRKFIQIDRDNFNDVMARIAPGLKLRVDNTLGNDGSQIAVSGTSQGGGLAIAVAGLSRDVAVLLAGVPFLCAIRRAIEIHAGIVHNPKILSFQSRSPSFPHARLDGGPAAAPAH